MLGQRTSATHDECDAAHQGEPAAASIAALHIHPVTSASADLIAPAFKAGAHRASKIGGLLFELRISSGGGIAGRLLACSDPSRVLGQATDRRTQECANERAFSGLPRLRDGGT
jgi:hypothetical protein